MPKNLVIDWRDSDPVLVEHLPETGGGGLAVWVWDASGVLVPEGRLVSVVCRRCGQVRAVPALWRSEYYVLAGHCLECGARLAARERLPWDATRHKRVSNRELLKVSIRPGELAVLSGGRDRWVYVGLVRDGGPVVVDPLMPCVRGGIGRVLEWDGPADGLSARGRRAGA